MTEVLIIGSGMSAVGAALGVIKKNPGTVPLILDVGHEPDRSNPVDQNLYDYCSTNDAFDLMIGQNFEGLQNLKRNSKYTPARLASPGFQFIVKGTDANTPIEETSFAALQTLSKGGLGNAWGAGSYRFNDRDLEGFPINASELESYYDFITDEIGVSGEADDLSPYFGSAKGLQPPLKLSRNAMLMLKRYRAQKKTDGVHIGRPRFAILSEQKGNRRGMKYQNLEFWRPHLPEIYTPSYTLDRLIQEGKVRYQDGHLVERIEKDANSIRVHSRKLLSGETKVETARKVIVAAGAINTARIILRSFNDFSTTLPLYDNPALQIPMVILSQIGRPLERDSFGSAHLISVYDEGWGDQTLQGAFLDLSSPARAEFFSKFPLAARDNLAFVKYLLPAMMVNLIFLAATKPSAGLQLKPDGSLRINGSPNPIPTSLIKKIIRHSNRLGAYSHPALAVRVPSGGGIHYAGCLPMQNSPTTRYECSRDGELHGMPGVYIADGAGFPRLPAKNHSFTLMANAMRIGESIT